MIVTGILRPSNEPGARNPSPGAEKMLRTFFDAFGIVSTQVSSNKSNTWAVSSAGRAVDS
jgi:hypothetical protein